MESLGAYACLFPFSATWWLIYLCFWWSFWTQICLSLNHGNHALFLLDCFCYYWNRYYFDPLLCQTGRFTLSSWYRPEAWAPDSSPIGKHYTSPLPAAPISWLCSQLTLWSGRGGCGLELVGYGSLKGLIYLRVHPCIKRNDLSQKRCLL